MNSHPMNGRPAAGPDFNGDGFADLALGGLAPIEGSDTAAQSVIVFYGAPDGVTGANSQTINQGSPGIGGEPSSKDSSFANSLAWGDFDADGYDDLAVGDSHELDDGALHVIPGSSAGLDTTSAQYFLRDSPGLPPPVADLEGFGTMVAAGDFDGDGFDDLAVSVSGYSVDDVRHSGAVAVLFGSGDGLSTTGAQWWDRQSLHLELSEYDGFGFALSAGDANADGYADLAIGAPQWSFESGAVVTLAGSPSGLAAGSAAMWNQSTEGVRGTRKQQEFFGASVDFGDVNADGYDDVAIAIPLEHLSKRDDLRPGAVAVLYGSPDGITARGDDHISQRGKDVGGRVEDRDLFGYSQVADLNGDGAAEVLVEVGGESVKDPDGDRRRFAGMLQILFGSPDGLPAGDERWTQDSPHVHGRVQGDDDFAGMVAPGDYNGDGFVDVAIVAPNEDLAGVPNAGAVHVLYGTRHGITGRHSAFFRQDADDIPGDLVAFSRFGYPLMDHRAT
jgi:hypothetical protein